MRLRSSSITYTIWVYAWNCFSTAVPIIIEGLSQVFQRFSSSKLVLKPLKAVSWPSIFMGMAVSKPSKSRILQGINLITHHIHQHCTTITALTISACTKMCKELAVSVDCVRSKEIFLSEGAETLWVCTCVLCAAFMALFCLCIERASEARRHSHTQ